MRLLSVMAALLLTASVCSADRPIFLVTPQGVWQSTVADGKPGPWVKISADVIVQGFTNGGPPDTTPPVPEPPVTTDPVVTQIAAISKATLRDKDDATAVAAIVDSVAKLNLSAKEFKEAIETTIPIADISLEAEGRLIAWSQQSLAVTSDPAKLKAGLSSAWGVTQATLDSIHAASANPESAVTGEAINWTQLIEIIQIILALIKNLPGIGGGT